jgi:hypothetical protein
MVCMSIKPTPTLVWGTFLQVGVGVWVELHKGAV